MVRSKVYGALFRRCYGHTVVRRHHAEQSVVARRLESYPLAFDSEHAKVSLARRAGPPAGRPLYWSGKHSTCPSRSRAAFGSSASERLHAPCHHGGGPLPWARSSDSAPSPPRTRGVEFCGELRVRLAVFGCERAGAAFTCTVSGLARACSREGGRAVPVRGAQGERRGAGGGGARGAGGAGARGLALAAGPPAPQLG